MIPRRRVPIRAADFREWLRASCGSPERDRASVAEFESRFAAYLGVPCALATASGRDAMLLALESMGLHREDEILVSAYTLGELMPLLRSRGYRPVPVDVDPETFNMDSGAIERRIGPRTRAVMATHILGAPCDMAAVCEVADRRSLLVLEDCAHALGAAVGERKVGTLGHAAIFSFEPTKAVPTYGGGMLVTRDREIADRARRKLSDRPASRGPVLRKALRVWAEEAVVRSPFYAILNRILLSERMAAVFERSYRGAHDRERRVVAYTAFQARLGLARLAELDARNERCNSMLRDLVQRLPCGLLPQVRDRCGHPAFYNCVVRSDRFSPESLRRRLRTAGIDIGIRTEVMDNCGPMLGYADCRNAENLVAQHVLFPVYEGLGQKDFGRIVGALQGLDASVMG
ncbi:DegT/DnrJ/EryC1/StrS family aminotransferase [Verrucomicrobiota bacterium]